MNQSENKSDLAIEMGGIVGSLVGLSLGPGCTGGNKESYFIRLYTIRRVWDIPLRGIPCFLLSWPL